MISLMVFFDKWPDDVDSLDKQKGDLIEEFFYTAEGYTDNQELLDEDTLDYFKTEEQLREHAKEILEKLKSL